MKNKIKKISFLFLILGLILIIGGGTYAFFNYTEFSNELVTSNGQVYMKMNKSNTDIILNNVFPETYKKALYVNGENGTLRTDNKIEFTVIGKNEYDNPVYYELDLEYGDEVLNKTRIDDEYLRFELLDITDSDNIEEIFSDVSFDYINEKKVFVDTIKDTDINYSKTYRLRMWYDENIIISDTDPDADFRASNLNDDKGNGDLPLYTDLFASVKIKVYGDFIEKVNPYAVTPATCFTYSNNGTGITIDGFNSSCGGEVRIPKRIEGLPVTEIGNRAFFNDHSITSISMPDTIINIGYQSFMYCQNLENVNLSKNLETIDDDAFYSCNSLNNLVLPNGITSIGEDAFCLCESLTSIFIPASLIDIGFCAFWDCTHLAYIVVDPNNPVYDSRNNCNAIIETSTNDLLFGSANTIIPNGIESIASYAFEGLIGLTSIEIPDSVTSIDEYAFTDCEFLRSVVIPDSVDTIGAYAFSNCIRLEDIYVEWDDSKLGYCISENSVFDGIDDLSDINLHVPRNWVDGYSNHYLWGEFNVIGDNGFILE